MRLLRRGISPPCEPGEVPPQVPPKAHRVNRDNVRTGREPTDATGEQMGGVKSLQHSWCRLLLLVGMVLALDRVVLAGTPMGPPRQPPISETDVSPQSRPLTHSQLLDEYLARLQERLKVETRSIQEPGLVEVKLTIRKDGSVTFGEIVVLDGPTSLRNDLLPLVNQLGPLPPPPIDADILAVSMLLPLRYPGPDLLDSIGQMH
jgi:hypothetical protein